MIEPHDLIERWRTHEELMRSYGQAGPADLLKKCRQDLEPWWRERELDCLTLAEASAYSGLHPGTIQRKVATGELLNASAKNRPRVRRGDLPQKATGVTRPRGALDLADRILEARRGSTLSAAEFLMGDCSR